ncbi:uncharacterized protein LOC141655528 [Silene latifolia]|uniref:uncharacterized protein LOC141655528 n=1 Tax=Silene latifolia TaxID=37657 RepID=UPI003D775A6B
MVNDTVAKPAFHPALAVNSIRNHITVILGMDNDQYPLWVALFTNHAKLNRVLHHIIKPKNGHQKPPTTDDEKELWETLDATVLQWIYSTVTTEILEMIVEADTTAMQTWDRLAALFQDNRNSRAVTLDQEFSHINMSDFPNASAYCQRLKSLADQLKNVGAPVTNSRFVLQLVSGLTEAYSNVGSIIRQRDPLPDFFQARSMLTLEKAGLAKQSATSALYAKASPDIDGGSSSGKRAAPGNGKGGRNGGGKKKHGGHKGGKRSKQQSTSPVSSPVASSVAPYAPFYGGWPWPACPWGYPPCPYPTGQWGRQQQFRPQAGILGSRPGAQAYTATGTAPTQTEIEAAMYTLGLTPPEPWVMDTGATSHMTSNQGNLTSFVNSSFPNGIVVGNGHSIPIKGHRHATLPKPHPPFVLKNVFYAPNIVKNLVSVRKFTTDNKVTVEFDPFGFCVKDLRTGNHLMRCDSRGDLYQLSAAQQSVFAAFPSSSWHARLGHPGDPIMSFLKKNKLIDCYPKNHRGYKCFNPSSNKIIISRHVIFDESIFPFSKLTRPTVTYYEFLCDEVSPYVLQQLTYTQPSTPNHPQDQPTLNPTAAATGSVVTATNDAPASPVLNTSPVSHTQPVISPAVTIPVTPQPHQVSKPTTRADRGIVKPNPNYNRPDEEYNLNTAATISPIPRNPVSAIHDPN